MTHGKQDLVRLDTEEAVQDNQAEDNEQKHCSEGAESLGSVKQWWVGIVVRASVHRISQS